MPELRYEMKSPDEPIHENIPCEKLVTIASHRRFETPWVARLAATRRPATATIVPGQHSVVRGCSMLDFPTSGKGQTAVNAFRNHQRWEFCNARIDLFENSSGGSFENEASRSSAGAVANPSGFENSRANSTLRQVVGSRSTG
jgi:hypothetical protein